MRKAAYLFLLVLMLGGCGYSPAYMDVKPRQEPMYNFTQSSAVLQCVGHYIEASGKQPIDIYISDIPDHTVPSIETGFLTKNAVMMVTTAVDRLNTHRVEVVGRQGGREDRRQLQMLGSFTELNRTAKSSALSGEAVFPGGFELEMGGDQNFNHVALDLAMSEFNRIVPGTSTSVSIQIHGNSGDVTLTYDEGDDFAAIGALGFTAQEGFHAAQRVLIETAVALMVSKYFDVDMKNCLQNSRKPKQMKPFNAYDKPVFPQQYKKHTAPLTVSEDYYNPYNPAQSARYYNARSRPQPPAPPAPASLTIYDSEGNAVDRGASAGPAAQTQNPQNSAYVERFDLRKSLPQENGTVVLPKNGGQRRYLPEQPQEYQPNEGPYAGVRDQRELTPAQ